jgi:hypothetical protein
MAEVTKPERALRGGGFGKEGLGKASLAEGLSSGACLPSCRGAGTGDPCAIRAEGALSSDRLGTGGS